MDKHLVLGIDVDGVLADFTSSYIAKLERVSGTKCTLKPGEEPDCWYWPTKYGFSPSEDAEAWEQIKEDPLFWATLKPLMETAQAVRVLALAYEAGHDVYFITNRMGVAPHMQTMMWLMDQGFPAPTVLLSPELEFDGEKISGKGFLAKGLQLTHFIDDKGANCRAVKEACPSCFVALLSKEYNKAEQKDLKQEGIVVVKTLQEFFTTLVSEEDKRAIIGARA